MITAKNAAIMVTLFVVIYIILLYVNIPYNPVAYMIAVFPFVLVWMVICILKDTSAKYPDLGGHEWGYRDKNRDELGLF